MISLILYCILGATLAFSGVNVIDKPWQFFLIIAIVIAIDYAD